MQLREEQFRAILHEMIDENPFAVRPMLKILNINFTESVRTLAVTCETRPELKINLAFINEHCKTDCHVKALICHEFLHILLNHTERHRLATSLHNVAFDAVINAIIHRTLGKAYSSMMSDYYAQASFPLCLLRAPEGDHPELPRTVSGIWHGLYSGKLVADDIIEILQQLAKITLVTVFSLDDLLGNHEELPINLGKAITAALDDSLKQMNGGGIWRDPRSRGVGPDAYHGLFVAEESDDLKAWKRKTIAVLQACVVPDRTSKLNQEISLEYRLPLMTECDKRAFLRGLWSPFIPDATWETNLKKPRGSTHVYLDVSGSMNHEMPHLVALLNKLRPYIRMPFWAFSDVVAKAIIKNGVLAAETTGGTSMNCVLKHVALTRPQAAVIVTDGYIEDVDRSLLAGIGRTRLHALISRDGSASRLKDAKITYTQLERVPA